MHCQRKKEIWTGKKEITKKKKEKRGKKKGKEREIVHCQRKKEVPKNKKGMGEENNIIIGGAIKIVYFGLTLELQCTTINGCAL